MSDNNRERISFRLRKADADLQEATKGLSSETLSDLARDGLRLILGIRTTRRMEVAERPIVTQPSDDRPTSVKRTSNANDPRQVLGIRPNQQRR